MRFTTRLTLLFALVLAAFVVSTLPVTAALLKGTVGTAGRSHEWEDVAARWQALDPETRTKAADLMAAIESWRAASATPSLEADARYLKFQTAFLTFSAFQALVLFLMVAVGLSMVTAPVRGMTKVVARLKAGDSTARLGEAGGEEWRTLARQFNSMLDQNQTLNRLQGWREVASFLSHQIKNPLTSIAFAEQNVRRLTELPPLAAQNLDIIGEQGRRINNLVRRLRDLTSFDELERTEVVFDEWVRTWASARQREGETWDLSLVPVGTVSLVSLLCEQALDNLLANTREAAEGAARIRVVVETQGPLVVLRWSDGNKLAEGVKWDLVGTARFTTKKDGSGLGVFFVRRIAELHGGGLVIGPSAEGGLSFTLTLEGGGHGPHPRRR